MRRVKQLSYLLASSAFTDHKAIERRVKERYDSADEVRHYLAVSDDGLYSEEAAVVVEFLKSRSPEALDEVRALVVGCGAGREALALAKMGLRVTAIDLSKEMISAARLAKSQVSCEMAKKIEFVEADLESFQAQDASFDFVFISSAIVEHIRGREARIQFYKKAGKLTKESGALYVGPEIQAIKRTSAYFWASQILRVRARLQGFKWQQGDSARAFFGKHNQDLRLVFYHFYPTFQSFESEINEAGVKVISHHEGGYLLRPMGIPAINLVNRSVSNLVSKQ
jgi:2-polyprenyl-3-methyl-5-hydroxy-6-metoxy-1,4-benzoquinol methylase